MTYIVDYSRDWQFIDGVEEVTYTAPTSGAVAIPNLHGKRRDVDRRDLAGAFVELSPTDTGMDVWNDGWSGVEPALTGVIGAADGNFTIISFRKRADGSQFGLVLRKQV